MAFSMVLHRRTDGQILNAFKEWLHERNVLPTPADILGICERNEAHERRYNDGIMEARNRAERERQRLADMRAAELAAMPKITENEFWMWFNQQKNKLKPKKDKKIFIGDRDEKHWNSIDDDMKKNLLKEAMERVKIEKKV